MRLVLPFHAGDAAAAVNLLRWMGELGPMKDHDVLLVADGGVSTVEAAETARNIFGSVAVSTLPRPNLRGWPHAPNAMFRHALSVVRYSYRCPFFWCEPDCIPLCPQWLDMLENEYGQAGMPFMGCIVHEPFIHLTGCAIYPHDAARYNPHILTDNSTAWDVTHQHLTLPQTHHTELYHHAWIEGSPKMPDYHADGIDSIPLAAVVSHRNKNQSLIEILRKQRAAIKSMTPNVYSYYEELNWPQAEFIEAWKKTWSANGWNPVVLNSGNIRGLSWAKSFIEVVSKFPTVNHPSYELACFKRWAAMASIGGGLMTDYDVMNNGLKPFDLHSDNVVFFESNGVPSSVYGSENAFGKAASFFARHVLDEKDVCDSKPHVSDQDICCRYFKEAGFTLDRKCIQVGDAGWETAPLIHFSNPATQGKKSEVLGKWLNK